MPCLAIYMRAQRCTSLEPALFGTTQYTETQVLYTNKVSHSTWRRYRYVVGAFVPTWRHCTTS